MVWVGSRANKGYAQLRARCGLSGYASCIWNGRTAKSRKTKNFLLAPTNSPSLLPLEEEPLFAAEMHHIILYKRKCMDTAVPFGEILEAVDGLSLDDQKALVDILTRRICERRRTDIARDIHEAQEEYRAGKCPPVGPNDLMGEILS
jgi:hypothetical protein